MEKIQLLKGDCLEIMKNIADESIDLIVTDPPYKLVSGGCTTKGCIATTGIFKQQSEVVRKGTMFAHNEITFNEWVPEVYRLLKQNTHCYIMVNGRNLQELRRVCENAGFVYQNLLIWNKGNLTPNKWYMNQCEFILMMRKGKAKNINNMGTSTLLNIPNIIGKKVHPTEKPVMLMEILVNNSTNENEIVLDPFMGAGSTGIACANTGRKFIGIEIDEGYFKTACERIKEAEKERE